MKQTHALIKLGVQRLNASAIRLHPQQHDSACFGKPLYKAVLDSGVARLRPILMTTIAMIAGMLPIALGIGAGSELRSPMAIAVIGGLTTSTLLTLVVVPVISPISKEFRIRYSNQY